MKFIIFAIIQVVIFTILATSMIEESEIKTYLDKSIPQVGLQHNKSEYTGNGIVIAVIDTGIDYTHPDLFGFGKDGKIIGGYDFIDNDKKPLDIDGHGTGVAGIIAADGMLKGVAPNAKILAYRVSSNGESVSSELIESAIHMAIKDEADIISISLGVNQTNDKIDLAVQKAIDHGIVVVAAAGNDGPNKLTIGSPGRTKDIITVGAVYNNFSTNLIATIQVGEKKFQLLPMQDAPIEIGEIKKNIIYGKYAKVDDLINIDVDDFIILVKRGSDVKDEKVFFSHKEGNAADAKAVAIIVYNNDTGIFLGELVHDLNDEDYVPRIPAFSMDGNDGIELEKLIKNNNTAILNIFSSSDVIVYFSSRGPVSEFYMKPDLVAPGVFINTTFVNKEYAILSGTSFATPHVAGAAALLLEKNPNLTPNQVKTILTSSSEPVLDLEDRFSADSKGSGRLNITSALKDRVNLSSSQIIFHLSHIKPSQSIELDFKPESVLIENDQGVIITYSNKTNSITATVIENNSKRSYGIITLEHKNIKYRIPILAYVSEGEINTEFVNDVLNVNLEFNGNWSYSKITVFDETSAIIKSILPNETIQLDMLDNGTYFISAKILLGLDVVGEAHKIVQGVSLKNSQTMIENIPIDVIYIIIGFILITSIGTFTAIKLDQQKQYLLKHI